jgi:hypothetical protein|tara:strand:+ start:3916 stop:4104 length:189 start_codon:yes stop_codon:yes gene_type:complete
MKKEYYIAKSRMNGKISDTMIEGQGISVEGYSYELISRAPAGRRAVRRLVSEELNTRITIYA